MLRYIIEHYGVGSSAMQNLFSFYREEPHEIIDVDYKDLSDQTDDQSTIESTKQHLITSKDYADSNN